jgi:signal transduction histidine kinase
MLQVRDSGIGLSSLEQEKIFSPFTQAEDTIRRRYGGSGLGLAICCELVNAMDGTIGLERTILAVGCLLSGVPEAITIFFT